MLSEENDTPTPLFKQHDKVQRLYISPNHQDKGFIFFYFLSIHTFIFRAFIIHKQEQPLLFLKFKLHSLIYCNSLLKVNNFIIGWSLNPIKRDYFVGVRSSDANLMIM
jgi:hypothetical protein